MNRVHTSHELYICIWVTNSTYVYESPTLHMYMSHVCVYTCVNVKECVTGMHTKARWIVCIRVTNSTYVYESRTLYMCMSHQLYISIWVTNSTYSYESRTVHMYISHVSVYACVKVKENVTGMHPKARWIVCIRVTNSTYVYESRVTNCIYVYESRTLHMYMSHVCMYTCVKVKSVWLVCILRRDESCAYESRTLHMYMSHQLYICIWFTNSTYVYESQTVHMYMSHVCVYACVNIKECVTGMHPKARWIVCIRITNST